MNDLNMWSHYLVGLGTGLSLIVAIGAQNAYILKQGIIGKFIAPIVLFCILSDILLIGLGVFGLGILVENAPWILQVFRWGGGIFLLWYGLSAALRAFKHESLTIDTNSSGPQTLSKALLIAAAMTYLNPHTYLDAVVLLGSLANQHGLDGRWWYYWGTITGSIIWFIALGFGARLLRPLFAKEIAWKVLDIFIACVMIFLSFKIMFMF